MFFWEKVVIGPTSYKYFSTVKNSDKKFSDLLEIYFQLRHWYMYFNNVYHIN